MEEMGAGIFFDWRQTWRSKVDLDTVGGKGKYHGALLLGTRPLWTCVHDHTTREKAFECAVEAAMSDPGTKMDKRMKKMVDEPVKGGIE